MSRLFSLVLCITCYWASAQPAALLHKSYSETYYVLDSIYLEFAGQDIHPALDTIEGWEKWAAKNDDPQLAGQLAVMESRLAWRKPETRGLFKDSKLLQMADDAAKHKLYFLEADILHWLGEYYSSQRIYIAAVEKSLTSYNIYKDFNAYDFPPKHEFLYDLGLTYFQYDDLENSLKYLREAENTPPSRKRDINYAVYNTIGLCYRKMKNYDSAIWYFKRIYDTALRHTGNDHQWVGIAGGNIGITYFYQGRYDSAIPLLKLDIATGVNNLKNTAKSMGILAAIYCYQGRTDTAEQLLRTALALCECRRFWPDYTLGDQLYSGLAKVYAAKHDMTLAYTYADSALLARDSVNAGNTALNLAKAQEQAEFLQKKLVSEQTESQKRIQLFRRNCLIGGLFLVTIIGILIINRQRLKRAQLEIEKKHTESELNATSLKLDSFREIDMQKRLLEEKNTELSQTIRHLEETQAQLVQAEKMASLGQLTAGIAHEINNPINFVSASIEPLQKDLEDINEVIGRYEAVISAKALDGEFAEVEHFKQKINLGYSRKEAMDLLKGMEQGALRTAEIVRGLRNFSRLDQNTAKLADLNEGIESTLAILYPSYKNRITVHRQFGALPGVLCFPGQLNQVFMNVLSNAIQSITGDGEIFINTKSNDTFVTISIRDTGCGMSRETMHKIFDPFFTTKEVGKGTGLGLSISYGIVQKHKGSIEVQSELNKGTEFVITIPINPEI